MASILCPACHTPNPEFNPSCSSCGSPLPLSLGPAETEEGTELHRTAQDDPLATRNLAHFRVLHPIGAGGMGRVYAAQDTRLGRLVALKVLPPTTEANPGQLERFRREIHALQRLRHPGVVQILDSGITEALPWYAMELIEGPSLRQYVEAPGRVPLETVLTLVRRLCGALAYVHGEGIVHRDLKPDNVLIRAASGERRAASEEHEDSAALAARSSQLTAPGWPVLVDFGVMAEFKGTHSRESLSADARAAGTPLYMAPEQLRGELLDARADLYSLGCVLYELLCGRPPFAGTAAQVRDGHLHQEPVPPRALEPRVPEPLEALVLKLLRKEPRQRLGYATDVAAALERMGAQQDQRGPEPRAYLYRPGFAGRQQALQELDGHLERLEAGRGGAVLIGGESGVGKTRLLLELGRHAAKRGVRVLAGECLPEGGGALEALRKPLQALGTWGQARGWGETLRLLGRYEPSLLALAGVQDVPEPAELPAEAARRRLFGALARSFGAWAAERPVLLALDDLQWADDLTLGFLELFLRAGSPGAQPRAPLLVVGAYRIEDVGAHREAPLRRLVDVPGAAGLTLARLDPEALGLMVREMLALEQPAELFERFVARQTEGNPLFAGEYLRMAVAEGVLYRDEQGRWHVAERGEEPATEAVFEALPLPGALRELLARRLDGLGAPARRVLEAASVLGREMDEALLGRMSSAREALQLEALQELLTRQVMEDAGAGRLRFAHDKLREVAYERLSKGRRKKLHRAAAAAIEAHFGPQISVHQAVLGYHWERAGDQERARACYLAAARTAVQAAAMVEAERLYRAYLALVEEPTAESIRARNELGWQVLYLQARIRESIEEHRQALAEARQLGDRLWQAASGLNLVNAYLLMGQVEETRGLCEQALATARELGNRLLEYSAVNRLAILENRCGRKDEAYPLYEQALSLTRELGLRSQEGFVSNSLANFHLEQDRLEESQTLFEHALAIALELGDRWLEAATLGNFANCCHAQGRIDEACAMYNEALTKIRAVGDRRCEGAFLRFQATGERQRGRLEEARRSLTQAEGLLQEVGDLELLCVTLCEQGHLRLAEGASGDGFLGPAIKTAGRLSAGPGSHMGQALDRLVRAQEAFEAGRPLYRGQCWEDLPEGLRRWIQEQGLR